MIRMFEQHRIRWQKELDGYWDFGKVENELQSEVYSRKLIVPGCWEQDIQLCTYRGKGVYKKNIFLEKGLYRLIFKGVSHSADVLIDGCFLGSHYNAYTEFNLEFLIEQTGNHELKVLVDNSFNEASALHIPNDYYTYGGIIRPVVLEKLAEVYIENMFFTSVMESGGWTAKINFQLKNTTKIQQTVALECYMDELPIEDPILNNITLNDSERKFFTISKHFKAINEWSMEHPTLYSLNAILKKGVDLHLMDDLIDRVGFRQISTKSGRLLLNEQPINLKGFNRHEDYNLSGCSLSPSLSAIDIALIKDLHANTVRTAHYPNDERFLDMCDENGLLVWEESHARGITIESMQNPNFEKQSNNCIIEMVTGHYNHPSIILWGILNECASDCMEGRRIYSEQFSLIKSMDTSRLLTYATCKHFTDLCLDLVDIISINIYHAWYEKERSMENILKAYEKEYTWIQETGGFGKPIIISEFGAGAIYGYRSPYLQKWTEERQAEIIERCLEVYLSRDEIVGTLIWQFADCRVTEEGWALSRPRGYNNKGIVDEYRRPKLAYQSVKRIFSEV